MKEQLFTKPQFKKKLKEKTGCCIQYDGWTCGTCFFSMSKKLNNQDWQSVLLYRGDYFKKELTNLPKDPMKSLKKVWQLINTKEVKHNGRKETR